MALLTKIQSIMISNFIKLNFFRATTVFHSCSRPKARHCTFKQFKYFLNVERNYCTNTTKYPVYENSFAFLTIKNGIKFPDCKINTLTQDILNCVQFDNELPITNDLTVEISDKLKLCSDEDLVTLLIKLEDVDKNETVVQLIKLIDLEGALRIPNGTRSVVLAGAMQLYILKMHFKSEWIWSCLKRFCRRLDNLSSSEVLQVMFLINLARKIPQQYSGFDIQYNLVNHIDNFSLDELAVVSIAFFKSETKMSNKVIMSKIMRKLLDEAETCGQVSIGLLCKIIKYSLSVELGDEILVLQDKLVKEVPRLELQSLTHVALAGTNVLVCNEKLIRAVIEHVRSLLPELRLKDMERLLFVMSLFDVRDADFTEKIIKELETREDEIKQYPKAFASLVNYLIILGFYQEPLINLVLSDKFIEDTYINYKKIGGELIFIDKSVEIERPDYKGSRLNHKIMRNSAKIMSFTMNSKLTGTQRYSYEIDDYLTQLYGKEYHAYISILPHFHFPDYLLCFNSNLVPKTIPQYIRPHEWGEVKKAPDNKHIWLCPVVGGWNTLIRNTEQPLGSTLTKMRQLVTLGFHPVMIPFFSYRQSSDKRNFIKKLIDEELKNISSKKIANTN